MKFIKCLIAVSLTMPLVLAANVPSISAPAAKAKAKPVVITQAKVLARLATNDRAVARKDVNTIMVSMAANVVVKLTIEGQGTQTMNRAQYRAMIEQGFKAVQNYRYKRTNTKITIAPGGQSARVTATVLENMQMNGTSIQGTTQETAILRVQGGRILVTSINAMARMTMGART